MSCSGYVARCARPSPLRPTGDPYSSTPCPLASQLWANLWGSDVLAVIDPGSGAVRRYVDLSQLLSSAERRQLRDVHEHVLNGIAHDPVSDRLFVTGKCWCAALGLLVAASHARHLTRVLAASAQAVPVSDRGEHPGTGSRSLVLGRPRVNK